MRVLAAFATAVLGFGAAAVAIGGSFATPQQLAVSFDDGEGTHGLAVVTPFTRVARWVVRWGKTDAQSPRWSPDGRQLAFTIRSDSGSEVVVSDSNGRARRRIAFGPDVVLSWSPDGKRLLVLHGSDDGGSRVYVVASSGGTRRWLTPPGGHDIDAAWAPDSSAVAVVHELRLTTTGGVLRLVSADGRSRRLTAPDLAVTEARFSPGGTMLALEAARLGSGRTGVWTFRLPNGPLKLVGPGWRPAWRSRGLVLAWRCPGAVCVRDLARADAQTLGIPAKATTEAGSVLVSDLEPVWSPAGSELAFSDGRHADDERLFVVDAGGRHRHRLWPGGPASEWHPSWSPDGKSIAFFAGDPAGAYYGFVGRADGARVWSVAAALPEGVLNFGNLVWKPR